MCDRVQDTEQQHNAKKQEKIEQQALLICSVQHILQSTLTFLASAAELSGQQKGAEQRETIPVEKCASDVLASVQMLSTAHAQSLV